MSQEEINKLQSVISHQLLSNKKNIRVLEAGCGSASHFNFGQNAYLVGIDISEEQLKSNSVLNEKILGDIQVYNLPVANFDVIVCWYVLEHLPEPEKALNNFFHAVKEDGIIILAFPNVMSIWGLITKYTPLWFHIWVYKHIFGEKRAGRAGHLGPFRTFSRFFIAPESIKQFAMMNGLTIEHFVLYENFRQKEMKEKNKILRGGWNLLKSMTKILSFGKIDAELTDCIVMLKKQQVNVVLMS
ncbi:methyltransferase type 12 [Fischerella thermalis CCMEE 5205]|nr:methyltransferase type 12 [Fischerella thermalis CCMEE 5205]